MSVDNNTCQIDAVLLLGPVIGSICQHVDQKDLRNIAKMCKLWRDVALSEDKKRSYLKQLRFSYTISNLVSTLEEIPSVSLLIYDSTLEKLILPVERLNNLGEELLRRFEKQLPKKTIVWRVDEFLTSEDTLSCGSKNQHDCDLTCNNMLGLFFPSVGRRIQVHVAAFQEVLAIMRDSYRVAEINRLAEELGLNECDHRHSAILLFSNGRYYNTIIRELVSRARQNGKEVGFASFFGTSLVANNCKSETYKDRKKNILVRICGPNLECWSTFIEYFAQKQEIDSALRNLKERVKRKRFCKGLFFARKCVRDNCTHIEHPCGNSREMMNDLKRTFPGVRFIGFYENCTFNTVADYERFHLDFAPAGDGDFIMDNSLRSLMSIIVISYD